MCTARRSATCATVSPPSLCSGKGQGGDGDDGEGEGLRVAVDMVSDYKTS